MKKVIFFVGIILILVGVFPLMKYALDYSELSSYGKGKIWGNILFVAIGILLIFISRRPKKKS